MPYNFQLEVKKARAAGDMDAAVMWRRREHKYGFSSDLAEAEERAWWAKHKLKDTEMPESNPKAAAAAGAGKLRLELIEQAMTHPVARVMSHGADKYGVRNWRVNPIYARTYIAALRRHIDEWEAGFDRDADSGEHPLAHVAANVQVVLDAIEHGTLLDDRDFAESKPAGAAANQPGGEKPPVVYEHLNDDSSEYDWEFRPDPPPVELLIQPSEDWDKAAHRSVFTDDERAALEHWVDHYTGSYPRPAINCLGDPELAAEAAATCPEGARLVNTGLDAVYDAIYTTGLDPAYNTGRADDPIGIRYPAANQPTIDETEKRAKRHNKKGRK